MAVQPSDNRFDWCDRLLTVRVNYSAEECCNILKSELAKFRGADPIYVAKVRSYQTKDFSISARYIPVYEARATVTYTWNTSDEEKGTIKLSNGPLDSSPEYIKVTTDVKTIHTKQLTFNRMFCRNITDELRPTEFTGRNDQRFYNLAHVDELNASSLGPTSVYSLPEMEQQIIAAAKNEHGGKVALNSWSCTMIAVPAFEITVHYNGRRDIWYINAHNGAARCTGYLVSDRMKNEANRMVKKVKLPHIVTYIAGSLSILVSVFTMNWRGAWFATLLSLLASFSVGIVAMVEASKQTESHIRSRFGREGLNARDEYGACMLYMWLALGALIFAALCAIIW